MPPHIISPPGALDVLPTDSGHIAIWSGDDREAHAFVLTPQGAADTAGKVMGEAFRRGAILPDADRLIEMHIATSPEPGEPIRLIIRTETFGTLTLRLTLDLLHQLSVVATDALGKVQHDGQA